MIVLDTNVISELMKVQPDDQVGEWVKAIINSTLTTTSVTVSEIAYGLHRLPEGKRKLELGNRFAALIGAMVILPLDDIAAYKAGQFRAARHADGFSPEPSDMMIAGIVASLGATLATRNIKDFETLPIQLIDPWRAH